MPRAQELESPSLQAVFAFSALTSQIQRIPQLVQTDVTSLIQSIHTHGSTLLIDALVNTTRALRGADATKRTWCVAAALPLDWTLQCTNSLQSLLTQCYEVRASRLYGGHPY